MSREEHTLRKLKNRMLRKIFGPNTEEGTGDLRKLHYEELNDLYSVPNIIWVIVSWRRVGYEACVRKEGNLYRDLVRKLEGQRPLGRCYSGS
jgi:hypothetical protein